MMSEIKRRVIVAAVIMIWLAARYVFASEPKTFESGEKQSSLIELFTSEGCSSCPPAEKWMSALKSSQDLWKRTVPIVFHVDYWDHLGWRDRFAKPEFTSRQQHYAATWGGDSVYTPSFVVNGKTRSVNRIAAPSRGIMLLSRGEFRFGEAIAPAEMVPVINMKDDRNGPLP